MTERKKPKKRWRFRRVETLEQLLKTEDPDSYGLVCWYLANRGTERYRAGDVINLDAWEKAGAKRKVQLTEQSIENIDRCLGMRTYKEASSLFTEVEQIETHGECPLGHQDAALDYLMHGIVPTKPCPECGEIPKFGDVFTNLGFGSNEPIKGIDGNEYHICPECGDDMLELRGTDPIGWGWNIVCTNCGWQLKQAEELDIHQYSDLMEDIKLKVEAIQRLLEMPGIINQTRVESVCLQLRMVLELIIFGSLVSNKDAWRKSQDDLRKAWNIKKILKDLRAIHRKYYPEPQGKVRDFLTEDRLVTVYDQLNKVIHAENPLGTGIDLRHYMESVPQWLKWIMNLLTEHKVFLYHYPNVVYWIGMFGGPEGTVLCTPIRVNSEKKQICMWPDCVQQESRQFCEYIGDSWQKCQLQALEPNQTEAKRMAKAYDR